jgi:hypothetical protein
VLDTTVSPAFASAATRVLKRKLSLPISSLQSSRRHDHGTRMEEVYRAHDLEISQRWRTP